MYLKNVYGLICAVKFLDRESKLNPYTFFRYISHTLLCLYSFLTFIPLLAASENPCMTCHANKKLQNIYINEEEFNESVHSSLECIDCHQDAGGKYHKPKLAKVDCSSCHEEEVEAFKNSKSGQSYLAGNKEAPWCFSCHGKHDIRRSSDPLSKTYPTKLPETCGKCHTKEMKEYEESIHGMALFHGRFDAPTCTSCH